MDEHSKIVDEIARRLTGDWETDIAYLRAEMVKYAGQPEMLRAIGGLVYEILPDKLRKEYEDAARSDDARLERMLSAAQAKTQSGEFDEAEKMLLEIMPGEEFYKSDETTDYFAFRHPIEIEFYSLKHDHKRQIRIPRFPFNPLYQLYAFALVEQHRFDEALELIGKALKRNPLFTEIAFEKAEIYKLRNDMEGYLQNTISCLEMIYDPQEMARYFRNLGYYFVERKLWDEAVSSYAASQRWDETETANSELGFIVQNAGKKIDFQHCADNWREIVARHGLPLDPDPLWSQVAWKVGDSAYGSGDYNTAGFSYSVVFGLTRDPRAMEKMEQCKRRLEKGEG